MMTRAKHTSSGQWQAQAQAHHSGVLAASSGTEPAYHDKMADFLLLQYGALRDEILKRAELQHQLILGTLLGFGTILTVGMDNRSLEVLFFYPFFSAFLASAWAQNDKRVRRIGQFLRSTERSFLSNTAMGWEHELQRVVPSFIGSRSVLAARAVFIGSAAFTTILLILTAQSTRPMIQIDAGVLAVVDALVIIVIALLLVRTRPAMATP